MMASTTSAAFTVATGNNPVRQRASGPKRASPPHRRNLQVVAKALYKSPSLARAAAAATSGVAKDTYKGVNHVSLLVDNLERSLEFYQGVLGLALHPGRPDAKLPYRGAWLSTGSETIHLIELEDPDRARAVGGSGRGAVRPTCIGVHDVSAIIQRLQERGIEYTSLQPEREAILFQDPDMKCLELATIDM